MSRGALVVVNYGSSALIEQNFTHSDLLEAPLQVIIVDNYSGVRERELIRSLVQLHGWTLITRAHNGGFGAGANAGMLAAVEAGPDAILLVNPDARVSASVALELLRGVRNEPLALMSPCIVDSTGRLVFEGVELELSRGTMKRSAASSDSAGWRRWERADLGAVEPWVTGACVALSRQLYERTGGFDERYFLYWEDVDLSVRTRHSGGSLVVRLDLEIVHDEGGTQQEGTSQAKSATYYQFNCRNRLMFAARHLDRRTQWRWLLTTPQASAEILLRGGRRQLLTSVRPTFAAVRGSLAGLSIVARSVLWTGRPTDDDPLPTRDAIPSPSERSLRVVIAIPTFRRPETLARILEIATSQAADVNNETASGYQVEILVLDNDPSASARSVASRPAVAPVRYCLEATPGVVAVRNRALDEAADADLLVFADDDERPTDHWLARMLRTHAVTGAAGVAGPVVPEFLVPPPAWIVKGRIFDQPDPGPTGSRITSAGAGNLLLDLRQTGELRFAPEMGLAGGEDTLFTTTMTRQGLRLVRCNEAVLLNPIPASRITRPWIAWRALSHGNSGGLIAAGFPGGTATPGARATVAARGLVRAAVGSARWAYGLASGSQRQQAVGLWATCGGAGAVLAAAGRVYLEYARPTGASRRRRHRIVSWGSLRRRSTSDHAAPATGTLVVLQSFPGGRPLGNPYRVLLEDALRATAGLHVRTFDWRTALIGHYDVFHIHWPETLLAGRTPLQRAVKKLLFAVLVVGLQVRRVPIVATVHNLELPQDATVSERWLLRLIHRRSALRIRLNPATPERDGKPYATVLHGHYRDWYAPPDIVSPIPGRVLFFGLVRRYKGVDGLISAFRQTASTLPGATLRVVGKPSSGELAEMLGALALGDRRISLDLGFVADTELVEEICRATLVVLPYPDMHNSAGVITALSLNRPVLVPKNDVNGLLRSEVGESWVQLYEGTLDGDDIARALRAVEDLDGGQPDLRLRSWDDTGQQHLNAYRSAVRRHNRGSRLLVPEPAEPVRTDS